MLFCEREFQTETDLKPNLQTLKKNLCRIKYAINKVS